MATSTILERGHRRIGFIDSLDPVPASKLRERGYRRALEAYGVAFDPALTIRADETITPDAGRRATEQLMARDLELTGLFCFNDRVASGAYRTLRRLGLDVPHDVSVVGFDDQADLAAGLDPPLSTIALPYEAMGRWAVDRLLDQIDGVSGADEPELHREYCPPVIRTSIAEPT